MHIWINVFVGLISNVVLFIHDTTGLCPFPIMSILHEAVDSNKSSIYPISVSGFLIQY